MVPSTYALSPGLAAPPSLPFGLRGGDGSPTVLAWGSGTVPMGRACPAYVSSLAKGASPLSLRCTGELKLCMYRPWHVEACRKRQLELAITSPPWKDQHPGNTVPQAPAQGWVCLGAGRGIDKTEEVSASWRVSGRRGQAINKERERQIFQRVAGALTDHNGEI